MAGLGDLTDLEQAAIDEEGNALAQSLAMFGYPDGNTNAPSYVPPFGNMPGYACPTPPGEVEDGYVPNAWLYPIDAENGLFGILDPENITGTPCGGMS